MDLGLLTTEELAQRIKYDVRTFRERLMDNVLLEGVHYIRRLWGRKILFTWAAVAGDMTTASSKSQTETLFKTYSGFVLDMTRQEGSAVDRLLFTRFGSRQITVSRAAPSLPTPGAADATPPPAQPPPMSRAQAVPPH